MRLIYLIILLPLLGFTQAGKDTKVDELEAEIQKTAKSLSTPLADNFITNFMGDHAKAIAQDLLKDNPFSKMKKSQVRSMLEAVLNNNKATSVLSSNPKAMDFLVTWFHDKEAMPSALSIINRPKEVKIFGYVVLAVFIISFMLNLINSKKGLLSRIFYKFLIFLSASAVNLLCFSFLFRKELGPSFRILKTFIF